MSHTVESFCESVARAVIATGVVTEAKIATASAVLKAEIKAFMFEAEYANERALALQSRDGERLALASLVAGCVAKIAAV